MNASAIAEAWPAIPYPAWRETCDTLHMWSQIVGKTRLALAPPQPHWWHIPLYVSARGFTTAAMPHGSRTVEIEFDFIDHMLWIRTSDGATRAIPLVARSVADFYGEYCRVLRALDVLPALYARPVEVDPAIPFAEDQTHASYDSDAAYRFWRATSSVAHVCQRFRGEFLGKSSPVHFFWGSFDLAITRFSGRTAPLHPSGAPNCPDYVMQDAYSHEVSSAGFWPGNDAFPEPALYAYAYPGPAGYAEAHVRPEAAYFHPTLQEFVLPYEAVRTSASPEADVMAFLHSTYDAAATLAGWDRAALDYAPR